MRTSEVLCAFLVVAAATSCTKGESPAEQAVTNDSVDGDAVTIYEGPNPDIVPASSANVATEAPTGFDGLTNGFTDQATMDANLEVFAEQEEIDEGLGPLFNAFGCKDCHGTPVVGGSSQVSELRAGHFTGRVFVDHPGGSLINERAIDASIQEHVLAGNEVRTFRMSNSILGAGFVEAIDSNVLLQLARNQPRRQRGEPAMVPVDEAGGALRVGRFGWKDQHASLISFAADAYLNEMGITSPLQPIENTNNGNSVADFDEVPDPEDDGEDIEIFAAFMRATKAPPVDEEIAASAAAQRGSATFDRVGCATCHVRSITTAPEGTIINGGEFTVTAELGDKIIHPFGDFLLHDVGTGDGIVQNAGATTRNKLRTAPLWGLRSRDRFMHDGLSLTVRDAIVRHDNQAADAADRFRNLSRADREDLLTFLSSL